MNKTERKNKTNLEIIWPTHGGYFTVNDLIALNPHFIKITLRVRLDGAIKKDKKVSIIGYKNLGKGRPSMILALNPVSQSVLDKAYNQDDVQRPEGNAVIPVASVNTSTPTATVDATPTISPAVLQNTSVSV
jgi:hypothetical protein